MDNLRDKKYLDIVTLLNRTNNQGIRLYLDCKELGILHLFWSRLGWEHEWITIQEDPTKEK